MSGRAWAYVLVVYGGQSYSRDIAHPCPSVAEEKSTMVVLAVQGAPLLPTFLGDETRRETPVILQ